MIRKIVLCALALLFSLYVGLNSSAIASTGVTHQVAQLEGDGGGGLVVAALCLLGGGAVFVRVWLTYTLFVLGLLIAILTGMAFQDPITGLWAVGPFILVSLHIGGELWQRRTDKRRHSDPHSPHQSV